VRTKSGNSAEPRSLNQSTIPKKKKKKKKQPYEEVEEAKNGSTSCAEVGGASGKPADPGVSFTAALAECLEGPRTHGIQEIVERLASDPAIIPPFFMFHDGKLIAFQQTDASPVCLLTEGGLGLQNLASTTLWHLAVDMLKTMLNIHPDVRSGKYKPLGTVPQAIFLQLLWIVLEVQGRSNLEVWQCSKGTVVKRTLDWPTGQTPKIWPVGNVTGFLFGNQGEIDKFCAEVVGPRAGGPNVTVKWVPHTPDPLTVADQFLCLNGKLAAEILRYLAGTAGTMPMILVNPSTQPPRVCENCLKPGSRKCSQCQSACYCSSECQCADWRRHSRVCKYVCALGVKADPFPQASGTFTASGQVVRALRAKLTGDVHDNWMKQLLTDRHVDIKEMVKILASLLDQQRRYIVLPQNLVLGTCFPRKLVPRVFASTKDNHLALFVPPRGRRVILVGDSPLVQQLAPYATVANWFAVLVNDAMGGRITCDELRLVLLALAVSDQLQAPVTVFSPRTQERKKFPVPVRGTSPVCLPVTVDGVLKLLTGSNCENLLEQLQNSRCQVDARPVQPSPEGFLTEYLEGQCVLVSNRIFRSLCEFFAPLSCYVKLVHTPRSSFD
jgi:hypothetical protein